MQFEKWTVIIFFQCITEDQMLCYSVPVFMPPSKKLSGHIGLGLCVRVCVRYALHTFKNG